MKTIVRGTIISVAILLASINHTQAIEGLKLSLQCSNVVLSWPCLDDGSESFIIQYRQTLDTNSDWQMLNSNLYADYGTNVMYYVHSNVVQNPVCDGGSSLRAGSESSMRATVAESGPMVVKADGTGGLAPLELYPPGFDLSAFLVYDPTSSEWLQGASFTRELITMDGPLDPPEEGGGIDGTNGVPPETGFYRVVRVGSHIVGVTNGMLFSGNWKLPVEVGCAEGHLINLTLTENGSPLTETAIHLPTYELPVPLMTLETSRMGNGVHEISAIARWQTLGGTNETDSTSFEAVSPPVSIVVSNEIFFPEWMPSFGQLDNSLLFKAETIYTNADWSLDVYGSQTNYIGTFTNHTDDGKIEAVWNLIGPGGEPHTNDNSFFAVVTVNATGQGSATNTTPKTYRQTDPWPVPGEWAMVMQHAFDHLNDHETLYGEMDGFVGMAQAASLAIRPNPQSGGQPYALRYQSEPDSTSDWTAFRQALFHPNARNLVYFGHGGVNGLGHNPNYTNCYITASEIAANLKTIPTGQTNRHAFRMVILDGCSTAAGTLPESFGILHKEDVPTSYYFNAAMRMSAFAGWSEDKYIGLWGNAVNYPHVHLFTIMQMYMGLGQGIKQAKNSAAASGQTTGSNPNELKIFGAMDLTFWGHNQ